MRTTTADELLYNQEKETYGMVAFKGSIHVLWRLPHLDYKMNASLNALIRGRNFSVQAVL